MAPIAIAYHAASILEAGDEYCLPMMMTTTTTTKKQQEPARGPSASSTLLALQNLGDSSRKQLTVYCDEEEEESEAYRQEEEKEPDLAKPETGPSFLSYQAAVISMLYRQNPSRSVLKRALLNALEFHAPLEIVRYIVQLDQGILYERFHADNTVLHLCILCAVPKEVALYLIDRADASLLGARNSRRATPFHMALAVRSSPAVWDAMVRRNPDAAAVLSQHCDSLMTVLHQVCFSASPHLLASLTDHCPAQAWRQRDRVHGRTPLHYLILRTQQQHPYHDTTSKNNQNRKLLLAVIRLVVSACPAALCDKDFGDRTPLTEALLDAELLRMLLEFVDPSSSLLCRDVQSRQTLLHRAAASRTTPMGVVQLLLEKFPAAARMQDTRGYTPLHIAAKETAPLPVVKTLLKAYPEAVTLCDRRGQNLLHFLESRHTRTSRYLLRKEREQNAN